MRRTTTPICQLRFVRAATIRNIAFLADKRPAVPDSYRPTTAPQPADAAPARPVLVICGGGNAGHAIAVAASREFEGDIDWLVGSEQKAEILRSGAAKNGVHATGVLTGRA